MKAHRLKLLKMLKKALISDYLSQESILIDYFGEKWSGSDNKYERIVLRLFINIADEMKIWKNGHIDETSIKNSLQHIAKKSKKPSRKFRLWSSGFVTEITKIVESVSSVENIKNKKDFFKYFEREINKTFVDLTVKFKSDHYNIPEDAEHKKDKFLALIYVLVFKQKQFLIPFLKLNQILILLNNAFKAKKSAVIIDLVDEYTEFMKRRNDKKSFRTLELELLKNTVYELNYNNAREKLNAFSLFFIFKKPKVQS